MHEQQSSSERSTALVMNTLWSSEPGPGPDRTDTEMHTHNSSAGAARKARTSQPAPPQTMPPVARRAKCIAATAQPNSVGNPSRTVQVPLCSSSRGQVRPQRYSAEAEGSSRPYSCQWGIDTKGPRRPGGTLCGVGAEQRALHLLQPHGGTHSPHGSGDRLWGLLVLSPKGVVIIACCHYL